MNFSWVGVGASQDFKILADSVAKQNKASNKPN